ncbi:galactitol-1-phosphate 5-dehydrogenase [Oscillospiraceae bacterium MB08-C2-2]|nr:galactitol-1-phosphate 5-dehydrogenase [Oscillospiraceae bacterium MB08-C2-2]
MKALVYKGPKQLEIEQRPVPVPKDGELLLKIKACGICGSDIHGYLGLTGRRIAPMVMGHEFSAEVVGLGTGLKLGFAEGDRVSVQPCVSCGECDYCLAGDNNLCESREFMGAMDYDGAFVEYLCVPERLAFKLPDELSYNTGALIEALAVSYAGVKKLGDISGKTVAIIGGGTIGLLALVAVKAGNPAKILLSDLSPLRLEAAKKLGADVVLDPRGQDFAAEVRSAFDGKLADVSIEAVGATPTVEQAIAVLKPGGTSVWIGNSAKTVEVNMQSVVTRALNIKGTYIYSHAEFGEAIEFIRANNPDLSALVSREVSLDDAAAMFQELADHSEKYLKCVVTF